MILTTPVELNSSENKHLQEIDAGTTKKKSDEVEPKPAAGGAGKGVRSGKKDRSGHGNIDTLEGLEHHQEERDYRISKKKSEQNVDNRNKTYRTLEDAEKDYKP